MMSKYATMWDEQLGCTSVIKQRIQLSKETTPIHSYQYQAGLCQRQLKRSKVEKSWNDNDAKPARTEWASQIVFEPKKDASFAFLRHLLQFNGVTVHDSYLLPRLDKCIDILGSANLFSILDANSGYRLMEVDDNYKNKATLVTHNGLFWYMQM